MSIILVFALILTGGTMLYNMQRVSLETNEKLSAQQTENMAQNIAHVGLERVMSLEVSGIDATPVLGTWSDFGPVEADYNGGTYSVVGEAGSCSGIDPNILTSELPGFLPGNYLMEVTSTGTYEMPRSQRFQDQTEIRHQIKACYVRLDVSDVMPPAFEYAFISNENFRFNAGIEIEAIDGEGNIHSNDDMHLGPNVSIDGHVTYEENSDGFIHNNAESASFETGPGVPMQPFDPEYYRPSDMHDLYTTGVPPEMTVPSEGHGPENPFVWFVDGDFVLDGSSHLVLPHHTVIIVTGEMSVGGSANITATGTVPTDAQYENTEEWIDHNLSDDGKVKAAFYADGDIDIHGSGSIVGNLYTNSDFYLSGGGTGSNLVGSVSAVGTIDGRGGGTGRNFWYSAIAEELVIPGVQIPLEMVSLVAISEWGDTILRYDIDPDL